MEDNEMNFGNEIYLGIDYSTGEAREDKAEYYEERDYTESIVEIAENYELNQNQ